jgi:16S rRNA (cytosine967-C5)-methyltransferase
LSRHYSHITSCVNFLENLKQQEPLNFQLKKYFSSNKKFGSTDRKKISSYAYAYCRIGHAQQNKTIQEKIIAGIFLCNQSSEPVLEEFAPDLNAQIHRSVSEKLLLLQTSIDAIFPHQHLISDTFNKEKFIVSFFNQPLVFIRTRPKKTAIVLEKLIASNVEFKKINETCFALPASSKIETIVEINKEVVIQDKSSQQVFDYVKNNLQLIPNKPQVWDCCAASGGKSILLHDILEGNLNLHVSDIRPSIINNLQSRFKEAGMKNYQSSIVDASKTNSSNQQYDIIICDAPCTGSGTWARTPEQLIFFKEAEINSFIETQKSITSQALLQLKKTGLFFYITCSVFKAENEAVVNFLEEKFNLQILQMQYIEGYELQADTMFVAVMQLQ